MFRRIHFWGGIIVAALITGLIAGGRALWWESPAWLGSALLYAEALFAGWRARPRGSVEPRCRGDDHGHPGTRGDH